ncbi:hypothetical protein GCM10012285_05160 [Streptomyces kronopolitis]|uniref:Hcy-binding domain-containing protein n=1 Tax=Streptomyces kronopolitis TaxID=1612435 RepID=A0ABQ2J0I0_9ACTN|nr:hypothetical protein GCM10012285_05160 [Streptomyces kronopolitis]
MVSTSSSLAEALAAGPLVLDGGLSNQLEAAGHNLSDALWSARLLAEEPEAVVRAHQAYYEAGAQVAITASYQATFEGFARRGIGTRQAAELLGRSVELAREAAGRARAGGVAGPLYVAASAGPYGAMLADGSEYRGRYGLSVAELERFHRPRLEVLAAARPDVLALETVPDADEARALLRAVRGARAGGARVSVVQRRGWQHACRATADGGVRGGGGGRRGDRGGGELLRAAGRGRRGAVGGAAHREAGGGLPQQRRELGRRGPGVAREHGVRRGAGRRLGRGRRRAHRRLLPGGPGSHRRGGGRAGPLRSARGTGGRPGPGRGPKALHRRNRRGGDSAPGRWQDAATSQHARLG